MLWLLALVPMAAAGVVFAFRPHRRLVLALVAAFGLVATLVLVVLAAIGGWTGRMPWNAMLALKAELTPLSALVAALVPAVALPVLVYAACRERQTGLARLVGLLLFFCAGMELVVIATDLFTLLIGWEVVGACSWALIAHEWRDAANPRAAQYAFIVTRLGDLGLFLAALAAYAGTGSFAYADLARLDATHLQIAAFGILVAAASKSGQLPFSPWLFRAMAGPSSASALLHAATMVAAGAYLLARLQPALAPVAGFAVAALAIGTTTALTGGVVALIQADVKKVLAASTSAHFGLMFVAVGAGFPGVAVLHLFAHGFFKALLFLSAGVAIERSGSHLLSDMRLGGALPGVAVLAAVGAAALAGLPPLGAGWTKEAIVAAAAVAAPWWSTGVVVAGGLSAAYAVRWLWLAYGLRDDRSAGDAPSGKANDDMSKLAPVVMASLGWLAVASVLLSALWLPPVDSALAAILSLTLPDESAKLIGGALVAVGIGALAGRWLAVRTPQLGRSGIAAQVADWWRLPRLIDLLVRAPVEALAGLLSRLDDEVVDAMPRAIAHVGKRVAARIANGDNRVVDRGVRLATAFVAWLSLSTSHVGELVADGIASGPARLVALAGEDARRLQSGLSHQAFAMLLLGTLALGAILFAATL